MVPVGELEYWLADTMKDVGKTRKADWANTAAVRIREMGSQQGDVWDFIRATADFQCDEASKLAGYP